MLLVLVCVLGGVIYSEGGYLQHNFALGIPPPLSINRGFTQDQLFPKPINYAVQDVPKKDVSYTLSYEDYLYLKRRKLQGEVSPFDPDPTESEPIITNVKGKPKRELVEYNVPCSDTVLKRSAGAKSINGYKNFFVGSPVVPEVHKHVYFHVPPPDFEEPTEALRVIEPPKKKVNILFIKVPSYEPKQTYLQQLLQNQQARIQDKTLIYVLSKQENLPQPVVLPVNPSKPEVYFIKYKTSNDIEPINTELSVPGLLQNVSPGLERRSVSRDP